MKLVKHPCQIHILRLNMYFFVYSVYSAELYSSEMKKNGGISKENKRHQKLAKTYIIIFHSCTKLNSCIFFNCSSTNDLFLIFGIHRVAIE